MLFSMYNISIKLNSPLAVKLLFLIALLIFQIELLAVSSGINIHDNWFLAREPDVNASGNDISLLNYDASSWVPAVVPGTVLTSYERAGLIDDPYYSNNLEILSQDYYNVNYWYRAEFTVPTSMSGKRIWLNFNGINWKADIYLNGQIIGDLGGAAIRGKYDITSFVNVGGTNALAVHIEWCNGESQDAPTFIGSQGWDWMPPIPGRNLGIYEDVYLSTIGDATIDDPFVVTDLPLPDLSTTDISIAVNVTNHSSQTIDGILTGVIEPLGVIVNRRVNLIANETKTVKYDKNNYPHLVISDPDLWWPNGYGSQNLHKLNLVFKVGSDVIDTESTQFGIREYSYDMNGHDLYLSVNGHPVMCKGGNWGFPDAMLKWGPDEYETALRLHHEMNFTMIRTWHGNTDAKAFYEACDKYGIMVFEDFWMHGYFGPDDPDMFMEAARDKIKRLRNRASVAIWCAKNEMLPTEPIKSLLPAALDELDGTRYYFEASNEGGIHGGVSYAIEDPAWYFGAASGFTTEIGSPCVPSIESMRTMMDEADLWPITTSNSIWAWHDWDLDIGNKHPQKYFDQVNSRYGTTSDIEDFCKKAQLINLETFKAIFEAWNNSMWNDCGGALLWMSQSAWPSTIWQTYDYYFEGTGAYYGCMKACEPVHIQWNIADGSVKAINNTTQNLQNLDVVAEVFNMDGTLMHTETISGLDAMAGATVDCFSILSTVGNNLALRKTALASSVESESHPADYATDGNVGSRWASDRSDPQWICVDLGSIQNIDSVILQWEAAYGSAYEIQVSSDAASWKTVYSTTTGDGEIDTISFAPVNARYVRMYGTSRGTWWGYSLWEFIINETGSMAPQISGLSEVHFLKLYLKDAGNNILSENFYWNGKNQLDYTAMETMDSVDLNCTAIQMSQPANAAISTTLTNNSSNIALAIRLKLVNKQTGDRVLPAFYSDNYFSLLPGETRTIDIEYDINLLNGNEPELIAEGWNIINQKIIIDGLGETCSKPYPSFLDIAGPGTVIDDIILFQPEPDCQVNLYDFAVFAAGWLSSGLYPPL